MTSTRIATEAEDSRFVYKLFTSFHESFPAITVIYRADGMKYGFAMPIDVSFSSGGINEPTDVPEYIRLSKEMADAWIVASKIIKHHLKSTKVYKEK